MATKITTFLMFQGVAEQAMTLYVSLFLDSGIDQIERYGPDGPGADGSVKRAAFRLGGREFQAIDSPMPHGFTFTPSISIFADCESEAELEAAFHRLLEGGSIMMPLHNYGFSQKFGWVQDRFGVSWQLNLP